MKKIALITASVLALGAASIAADADGLSFIPAAADFSDSSLSNPVSAATAEAGNRGLRPSNNVIKRKVRLVSSKIAPVVSCDIAYWPYYPSECLKRTETADL